MAASANINDNKDASGKNRKKKKHISKHILASEKESGSVRKGKKKGKKNHKTKDINEAQSYLTNWKKYREQWKFNKNTQSWLIRHMYEPEKVVKGSFTILLEYLSGLQGKQVKQRIIQDANRRAIRYKKYEDKLKEQEENDDEKNETEGSSSTANDAMDDDDDDDEKWNKLDDHDKRKEYKRARKILEVFKDE